MAERIPQLVKLEDVVEEVERATREGRLLFVASELVGRVACVCQTDMRRLLVGQYWVARQMKRWSFIRDLRRTAVEAAGLDPEWVDEHLPSKDGRSFRPQRRPVVISTRVACTPTDFRIKQEPSIPVKREFVMQMESFPSLQEGSVIVISDGEESDEGEFVLVDAVGEDVPMEVSTELADERGGVDGATRGTDAEMPAASVVEGQDGGKRADKASG